MCDDCGTIGMDCSGGVLKLMDGFWYDPSSAEVELSGFVGTTPVYACLNPNACEVRNDTNLECPDNAGGALCGICNEGYVPDVGSERGACKICPSSMAMRWTNKAMMIVAGGIFFFIIAMIVMILPAPHLKIDKFLTAVHVRIIVRRVRKKLLLQIHERERNDPHHQITRNYSEKYTHCVRQGKLDTVVSMRQEHAQHLELQRIGQGATAAGMALASLTASTGGGAGGGSENVVHALGQVEHMAEDILGDAGAEALGETDVDGAAGLMGAIDTLREQGGGEGGEISETLSSLWSTIRDNGHEYIEEVRGFLDPNQLKIMMGNLQINASVTVVFEIPWPPIHTQFIGFLSIFKLDLFKGLAFAAPCLHSNHFMSLAGFIATPILLVFVFFSAFIIVSIVYKVAQCCPSKQRRKFRKLVCCKFTIDSARTSMVKILIVVILFIYPTICSKVFMTFKCIDVGASGAFMVADMAVSCYETEWLLWAGLSAVAMATYIIGIPVLLVFSLWLGQRRGTLQFPEADMGEDPSPAEVTHHVKRQEEFFGNRLRYGNLYSQYEPEYWWFEFCCTMRKMILTGALVLFGAGTAPQVVIALTVCILWFGLVANLKPFGEDTDDRLAQVEALQILFTLMIGLVLQLQAQ
jgi:hypothetical protein